MARSDPRDGQLKGSTAFAGSENRALRILSRHAPPCRTIANANAITIAHMMTKIGTTIRDTESDALLKP